MNRLSCTLLVAIAAMGVGRAQVKIAVINSQKALLETDEIKKAQMDLEARFKPRQDKIVQLEKELQDLQAQLQSGKLSAAGEQELHRPGAEKAARFAAFAAGSAGRCGALERTDILQRAGTRMQEVVKKIAERKAGPGRRQLQYGVLQTSLRSHRRSRHRLQQAYPVK